MRSTFWRRVAAALAVIVGVGVGASAAPAAAASTHTRTTTHPVIVKPVKVQPLGDWWWY